MSKQITLTLRDDLLERAEMLAGRTGQGISDVLAEAIEASLDPIALSPNSMAALSDREVIDAANAMMDPADAQQLAELLEKQQAGQMSADEKHSLQALMRVYGAGMLNKSDAIAEAVRRGLRQPPKP